MAVTVLALGLALLIGLLPSSSLSLRMGRERTLAGGIAQSYLEEHLQSPASIVAGPLAPVTLEEVVFTPTVAKQVLADPPGTTRVRVTVTWKHQQIERSVFRELFLTELPR